MPADSRMPINGRMNPDTNPKRKRGLTDVLPSLALRVSVAMASVLGLAAPAPAADLAARQLAISQMSPSEQQELLRKQDRFLALPLEEQNRLRALQAAIDTDPHAEKLHEILQHYHEWLKTLAPTQRADLADGSPEERVKQIQKILLQQRFVKQNEYLEQFLTPGDFREILNWTERLIWSHKEGLISQMSEDRRASWEKLEARQQRRALMSFAFERSRRGGGIGLASVEQGQIDKLAEKLSPDAKAELARQTDLKAQRRLIVRWAAMAMHRNETWQAARKMAPFVGEDLVQFFRELKPADQQRLLKLPQEQMRAELRRMYYSEHAEAAFINAPRLDRSPDLWKGGTRKGRPNQPGKAAADGKQNGALP